MIKHIYVSAVTPKGETIKTVVERTDQALSYTTDSKLKWLNFVIGDVSLGTEMISSELKLTLPPSTLLSGYLANYEDRGEILGMMLPIVRVEHKEVTTTPFLIYLVKNQLITIHDEYTAHLLRLSQYSDSFMKKLPISEKWQDAQTLILMRVIDEVSERNFRVLRAIIEEAELLQMDLARTQSPPKALSIEIFHMKQSVLTFLNAVWAIRDVVHSLRYGDAEMISDDQVILAKFDIILADIDRQMSMAEHVLEILAAGMSVLQTMFQANLQSVSNLMTKVLLLLTIFGTAILVPNTLATIYGIPYLPLSPHGDSWFWLVLSLIVSTILGTMVVYIYVRHVWKPII